jgi:cytochrome P450
MAQIGAALLTRPSAPTAATCSSARGTDLDSIRKGLPVDTGPRMIIMMDPPSHRDMRSLLNKVFTHRAIQAQKQMVTEKIDKYLNRVDRDGFDAVGDFAAPFPVEVITTMLGAPEEDAQKVRRWVDLALTREIGQLELTEEGTQAPLTLRCTTTG